MCGKSEVKAVVNVSADAFLSVIIIIITTATAINAPDISMCSLADVLVSNNKERNEVEDTDKNATPDQEGREGNW